MQLHTPEAISMLIWDQKYRLKSFDRMPLENSLEETQARIAKAVSVYEPETARWSETFQEAFADFQLIPAGRITAGAGTERDITFVNTFMMGLIPDDFKEIYRTLGESAETLRAGGGIGCNFSALRPQLSEIKSLAAPSSGPLPYMDLWDQMCQTTMLGGVGRGAMMAMLRCDHPDILDFVSAKRKANKLLKFNMSVLITENFIDAILEDSTLPLHHNGTVYTTISAVALWRQIMEMTYDYSEPGVLFIDRMNALNNLKYCEEVIGTNSCGEVPLPPYGSCPLASVNLARLVEDPFQPSAHLDLTKLANFVKIGVRLLDNVLNVTRYPLARQRAEAQAKRRIGLGITGLADALIMCGATYGTTQANTLVAKWMDTLRTASYLASAELAKERGPFSMFDCEKYLAAIEHRQLPAHVITAIQKEGIRNGTLTAIAPTGTMAMYAGNVSSGIEPVYSFTTTRQIILAEGRKQLHLHDYAYAMYRDQGGNPAQLPDAFITANQLTPGQHLATQALVQRFIDASISKTINCPEDLSFPLFEDIYLEAYRLGCKGCTTYRPSLIRKHVLSSGT